MTELYRAIISTEAEQISLEQQHPQYAHYSKLAAMWCRKDRMTCPRESFQRLVQVKDNTYKKWCA